MVRKADAKPIAWLCERRTPEGRGGCLVTPSAILESALYVTDLAEAEAFYRDIIGLEALGKVEGGLPTAMCQPRLRA